MEIWISDLLDYAVLVPVVSTLFLIHIDIVKQKFYSKTTSFVLLKVKFTRVMLGDVPIQISIMRNGVKTFVLDRDDVL